MPVYPSGGTIAQSVGSPGFGPAPTPSYTSPGSVRFNPADTAYFSYTPTLQGSRTTWTWSGWVKRGGPVSGSLYNNQVIFSAGAANPGFVLAFDKDSRNDAIQVNVTRGTNAGSLTNAIFRDFSAWYSIVLAFDSTQATASDRIKLWVNGQLQTWAQTNYPSLNAQYDVNNTTVHNIGRASQSSVEYFSGYLAEVHFVDGQALTPASFTETSSTTGQLIPISTGYTGVYGTNGFYLPFSSNALAVDLGQNKKVTGQDGYWPYNTLLVNTTSTNGAQNNTFLDSSTNNFTITRNGNTTQGRFGPFEPGGGTTQANGYYSGFFDGTGDYLSLPASGNASYINGTGNFTIDFWVYYNALPTGSVGANTGCSWYAQDSGLAIVSPFNLIQAGNTWYLYADTGAGTWNIFSQVTIATTTLSAGQWYHVACVRDSTNIRLYINGVQVGTASIGAASIWQNTVRNLYLFGAWQNTAGSTGLNGYVSNYRLVKGTCLYPGGTTFTVPTTPLTAITNTSLLTCQSSQFIDNSANAFTITTVGNTQPLPTNPFGMTAWSGYFDGTGDYLSMTSGTSLGSGDFTIGCWVYMLAAGDSEGPAICSSYNYYTSGFNGNFVARLGTGNQWRSFNGQGTQADVNGTFTQTLNTWFYMAWVRSGSTVTVYRNGVSVGSVTDTKTFSDTANGMVIGAARVNGSVLQNLNGYISNFRILVGTADSSVPSAPFTAISGTSLLTCQSSTFVDNSPNAFPITVNGNTSTLTLNNPFNSPINYTTPPTQSWSNYFDGSGDYLNTASNNAFGVGSGNFTVECWIYLTQNFDGTGQGIITASYNTNFALIGVNSGAGNRIDFYVANIALSTSTYIPLNAWTHIAVVRLGSTTKIYFNGFEQASSGSLTGTGAAAAVYIGTLSHATTQEMTGYISSARLVKGTAVYTSNFTPPTAPLTAIRGTSLLTCQSNRFVDNSLTNATLTINGNTSISPLSPFIPTTAWTAASNGGSMYFDGTGDFLTVPNNAAFDLGSGNATIEAWVFPASSGQTCGIFDKRSVGTNYSQFPQVALVSGAFVAYVSYTGSSWAGTINGATPAVNTWTHVAFVRNGNTWTLYVNGVVSGTPFTAAGSVYTSTDNLVIGASTTAGLNPINGYIANARIIKGTALYTTPFVPPVLPPTNISNTSLLLNATNSGIYDATGKNVIETVGNAQVSTAVKKFGESSMYFDGSGDYLVIPPRVELYLSTNQQLSYTNKDFTIEFWMYPTTVGSSQSIITRRSSQTARGFIVSISSGGVLFVGFGDASTAAWEYSFTSSAGAIAANTWQHVAVTRLGATYRTFVNGALLNSAAPSAFLVADDTSPIWIGQNGNEASPSPFNGYLQDVRFTIGAARYQGAFTPPAAAFAYNQYDIGNQQWSPNNISVTAGVGQDNLFDSPSDYGTDTGLGGQVRGNYCTLNAAAVGITALSNGNLQFNYNATYSAQGTIGVTSGKWYFEGILTTQVTAEQVIGVVNQSWVNSTTLGANANGWGIIVQNNANNGQAYHNGSVTSSYATFANGDIAMVAFDVDSGKIWFGRNGTWFNSGAPASGTGQIYSNLSGTIFPAFNNKNNSGGVLYANFGQRAFAYTAPAGFKCLVSTNLPAPTIGTTSSTRADDYFNTVLWTGNGSNPRSITGVGFQPDMVWSKTRSQPYSHGLYDAVRGAGGNKRLYPNETYPENGIPGAEGTVYGSLTSFDSDGFSVNAGTASNIWFNANNETYVAWNWKANGAGVANTAGTIPATVSANTTSGCSIVTFSITNASSTISTFGHGLGVAPSMVILKVRNVADEWTVYHSSIPTPNNNWMTLNTTNAAGGNTSTFSSSSTTFGVRETRLVAAGTGGNIVAYCFAPISGFSATGSYTGNGSTDGPFVYTNFRPEFVMIKCSSAGSTFWVIQDGARSPSNAAPQRLFPNAADAEVATSAGDIDILSNGFKIRNTSGSWNTNAATYIYIAFAEFPFKYSRAR